MVEQREWLQGAVVYQIYPRSFYDALGTGIGNLRGIIDKLDYLGGTPDSLGVTAIWLSPIYRSPMADFGYDVSDYCDIDPIFGTLDDLKELVREAHTRSIKIILDFVPNHSSDEHPWFIESKTSLDSPKRDWYIWHNPAKDGGPPNNWLSVFGNSAWQFSEQTKQYYLHSFDTKQPDLNWDNPGVREAMKSAMRFWLDLGIDGFRVDAVDWLSKDEALRNDPINKNNAGNVSSYDYGLLQHRFSRDGPHLFEYINDMAGVLSEYADCFMITEAHPESDDKLAGYLQYYQSVNPQLSAPFNFEGIHLPWKAPLFRHFVDAFQSAMKPGYTPIYTLGNHDESRIATRIGVAAARTAAMMLLTLPGMAFLYYGEELGMTDESIPEGKTCDPFAAQGLGRDPQRTPMLWDASLQAGFTTGTPWLPVSANFHTLNATSQSTSETSLLALYKQLIHFREQSLVLKHGAYRSIPTTEAVYGFERSTDEGTILILLNFSDQPQHFRMQGLKGMIQLSTRIDRDHTVIGEDLELHPNEGLLIGVTQND